MSERRGFNPGTTYSFRLVARGEGGSWIFGAWSSFTAECVEQVCEVPSVISFSNSATAQASAATAEETIANAETPSGYTGCGVTAVIWSVGSPAKIIDRLKQWNLGVLCADYYFAQERAAGEKLEPACLVAERASWPSNFHAAPVFHWASWKSWIAASPGTRNWYKAGLEFRARMAANGCKPGDRWLVNELESAWFGAAYSESVRQKVRARIVSALKGLYYGGTQEDIEGFASDVVRPHNMPTDDMSTYKSALKLAYRAHNFWKAVPLYTLGWSKQVYNRCQQVCTGDPVATIATNGVNNYSYHQRFLALAAPSTFGNVKATLRDTYSPLLAAVWNSGAWNDPRAPYGSKITLGQMARLIRQQVYSARLAANYRFGSFGAIGFAWKETGLYSPGDPQFECGDGVAVITECEIAKARQKDAEAADRLAANLAASILNAYSTGAQPLAACRDNDGPPPVGDVHVGCRPTRAGAAYNLAWNTFKTW